MGGTRKKHVDFARQRYINLAAGQTLLPCLLLLILSLAARHLIFPIILLPNLRYR